MAAPNFQSLLNKPADDVVRPVTLPEGTYYGTISGHEFGESTQKKTPYVQFNGALTHAHDDVELVDDEGKPIDVSGKKFPVQGTRFYLSDAAMFMLVDFLKGLGIETEGRSLGEIIPQAAGHSVQLAITKTPVPTENPDEEPRWRNEVSRMSAVA